MAFGLVFVLALSISPTWKIALVLAGILVSLIGVALTAVYLKAVVFVIEAVLEHQAERRRARRMVLHNLDEYGRSQVVPVSPLEEEESAEPALMAEARRVMHPGNAELEQEGHRGEPQTLPATGSRAFSVADCQAKLAGKGTAIAGR